MHPWLEMTERNDQQTLNFCCSPFLERPAFLVFQSQRDVNVKREMLKVFPAAVFLIRFFFFNAAVKLIMAGTVFLICVLQGDL